MQSVTKFRTGSNLIKDELLPAHNLGETVHHRGERQAGKGLWQLACYDTGRETELKLQSEPTCNPSAPPLSPYICQPDPRSKRNFGYGQQLRTNCRSISSIGDSLQMSQKCVHTKSSECFLSSQTSCQTCGPL